MSLTKKEQRIRRSRQTRVRIATQVVARLTVHRTNLHIYASVISEDGTKVLASASTAEADVRKELGAAGKGGNVAAVVQRIAPVLVDAVQDDAVDVQVAVVLPLLVVVVQELDLHRVLALLQFAFELVHLRLGLLQQELFLHVLPAQADPHFGQVLLALVTGHLDGELVRAVGFRLLFGGHSSGSGFNQANGHSGNRRFANVNLAIDVFVVNHAATDIGSHWDHPSFEADSVNFGFVALRQVAGNVAHGIGAVELLVARPISVNRHVLHKHRIALCIAKLPLRREIIAFLWRRVSPCRRGSERTHAVEVLESVSEDFGQRGAKPFVIRRNAGSAQSKIAWGLRGYRCFGAIIRSPNCELGRFQKHVSNPS